MSRGKASGISLTNKDATLVLGMVARGDRDHDIAAWFGVNQGRIAEVKSGSHGQLTMAPAHELPPKGPPGLKGRLLRASSGKALEFLKAKGDDSLKDVIDMLSESLRRYDSNER
jgi:hypothetical protein